MTARTDIEGTCARWFATDAAGHIGVFTGGYAAWPAAVFIDYAIVGAADAYLDDAHNPYTDAIPTARHQEHLRTRPPPLLWDEPIDEPTIEASQGLFSFDAGVDYGGRSIYYLDARPRVPLLLAQANIIIQRAAQLVCFERIRFADIEQFDIALHTEVVVGRG